MLGAWINSLLERLGLRPSNLGGPSRRAGHAANIGAWGEREAEKMLRQKGYAIIGRNVVTPHGEADLVCRDPDGRTMVIVEVKSRVVRGEGIHHRPERAVDRSKSARLRRIARGLRGANGWWDRHVRVDVVAVERVGDETQGQIQTRHHEGLVRLSARRA
ncbi:MAG: YraN family protein [Phycisphaeraceae bacterium]|nr:YraN family protein [Phycisphaeraceae bacterium]